jgi:hypothetical protein
MLTNPFNTASSDEDPVKEPFMGDYSVVVGLCEIQPGAHHLCYRSRRFTEQFLGGLKGKMAPGDAHPYLVPFCLEKICV